MLALPKDKLHKPRVGRTRAKDLTKIVLTNFAAMLVLVERTFQEWKIEQIRQAYEGLERRANVYFASALDAQNPWTAEQKKRHQELNRTNREHDECLFTWAWAHFKKNSTLKPILIDIRKGHGCLDDAEDIVREVRIFRDNLEALENRTPVTIEYLNQAERDTTEQIELIGLRDEDHTGSPLDMRRRAYTAWETDYNRLVRDGRYLGEDVPDIDSLFPKISAEHGATSDPEPVTEPTPTETTSTPSEPSPDGSDT